MNIVQRVEPGRLPQRIAFSDRVEAPDVWNTNNRDVHEVEPHFLLLLYVKISCLWL